MICARIGQSILMISCSQPLFQEKPKVQFDRESLSLFNDTNLISSLFQKSSEQSQCVCYCFVFFGTDLCRQGSYHLLLLLEEKQTPSGLKDQ